MYFFIVIFVPTSGIDSTFNSSIKLSIIVNPIPERSNSAFVVYNGFIASSTLGIPFPLSEIWISIRLSFILHSIFTMPKTFSYPWIIEFVTASDTAVFISASSSIVGSNWEANAATLILAKASFVDLLTNSNFISLS